MDIQTGTAERDPSPRAGLSASKGIRHRYVSWGHIMIDQTDRRLQEWVQTTLGLDAVSLEPPHDGQDGRGISLFLIELREAPAPRGTTRPPLQLALRYLITAWAPEPAESHRLLGELVLAAMEQPDFQVELEPSPPALWTALGVTPRPAFFLRIPLRLERPEPPVHRVRVPLVVRAAPMTTLQGTVVGPGDVPIMGARVELVGLGTPAYTDSAGHFAFTGVPGEMPSHRLHVQAKGRAIDLTLDQTALEREPLIIRFETFD